MSHWPEEGLGRRAQHRAMSQETCHQFLEPEAAGGAVRRM